MRTLYSVREIKTAIQDYQKEVLLFLKNRTSFVVQSSEINLFSAYLDNFLSIIKNDLGETYFNMLAKFDPRCRQPVFDKRQFMAFHAFNALYNAVLRILRIETTHEIQDEVESPIEIYKNFILALDSIKDKMNLHLRAYWKGSEEIESLNVTRQIDSSLDDVRSSLFSKWQSTKFKCSECGSATLTFINKPICSICYVAISASQLTNFTLHNGFIAGQDYSSSKNKILIFSQSSNFYKKLCNFASKLNIDFYANTNCTDPWFRDLYIDLNRKEKENTPQVYIRGKSFLNISVENSKNFMPSLKRMPRSSAFSFAKNYYMSKYNIKIRACPRIQFANSTGESANIDANRANLHEVAEALNIRYKYTIRPAEGGNIFNAVNKNGELCVIIGKAIVAYEFDIDKIKQNSQEKIKNYEDYYTRHEAAVLLKYQRLLGIQNIFSLPQWIWHLDLLMAYLGGATFILHCFKEAITFCQYYLGKGQYDGRALSEAELSILSDTLEIVRGYDKKYRPVIDEIEKILVENNFNVIRVCGYLHKKYDSKISPEFESNVASSVMNGIDFYKNNQAYYVVGDAPSTLHQDYFKNLLNSMRVQVEFILVDSGNKEVKNATDLLRLYNGGLRCQTNFLTTQ